MLDILTNIMTDGSRKKADTHSTCSSKATIEPMEHNCMGVIRTLTHRADTIISVPQDK